MFLVDKQYIPLVYVSIPWNISTPKMGYNTSPNFAGVNGMSQGFCSQPLGFSKLSNTSTTFKRLFFVESERMSDLTYSKTPSTMRRFDDGNVIIDVAHLLFFFALSWLVNLPPLTNPPIRVWQGLIKGNRWLISSTYSLVPTCQWASGKKTSSWFLGLQLGVWKTKPPLKNSV